MKNTINQQPKILFIVGVHANEEYSKDLAYTVYNILKETHIIELFDFDPSNTQTKREVSFNLNREDQLLAIQNLNTKISELEDKIKEADIVIDFHNSPYIQNLNLISYTEKSKTDFKNWRIPENDWLDPKEDLWFIIRKTKFKSISTIARDLGKISVTCEISGMISFGVNEQKLQEDFEFIFKTVKTLIGFYNNVDGESICQPKNIVHGLYFTKTKIKDWYNYLNNPNPEFIINSLEMDCSNLNIKEKDLHIKLVGLDSKNDVGIECTILNLEAKDLKNYEDLF